jgi:hypothetical protein
LIKNIINIFFGIGDPSPNPEFFYSSSGAPTGQTPAQVPQEIHADASITNLSSPCEIHPTGHSAAQAPQEIHLSVILYAILLTS